MSHLNYQDLKARVSELAHAYYTLDAPQTSDAEYDNLFERLKQMEQADPSLITPSSPTQTVGGGVLPFLKEVTHTTPMLSLGNAMTQDAAVAAVRSMARDLQVPEESLCFTREPKYDGLSCSLRYVKGKLVQAVTRGDGSTGEDVTAQVRTIKNIPKQLIQPLDVLVRGEVLMSKASFHALNERQAQSGGKPYANPRNAAAGSLRTLNPATTASRNLTFYAYAIPEVDCSRLDLETQEDVLVRLVCLGFTIDPSFKKVTGLKEVLSSFDEMASLRDGLPIDIDGVVYKLNDFEQHKKLGWTSRTPKWAVAYKFAAQEKESTILSIDVQVGRTGVLTPVARLTPVSVGGVVVANVTLHNQDQVHLKGVDVGDTVSVRRAGDVIPEIVRVIHKAKEGSVWLMPTHCPTCASPVLRVQSSHVCSGGSSCAPQRLNSILHYASRTCLDIEGLGEQTVSEVVAAGMVEKTSDLYQLTVEDLLSLDGWRETSATKLVKSIQELSVGRPLQRFIFALGIANVGAGTGKRLAEAFGTWDAFRRASREHIANIVDIGPITTDSIMVAFQDPTVSHEIDLLASLAKPQGLTVAVAGPLTGKVFVITGSFSHSRDHYQDLIEQAGGKVSNAVSPKTSYLLAGEGGGSKLTKAASLGIPVLDEAQLVTMLNTNL